MAQTILPHDLKAWIRSGEELAILDLREAGAFTEAHLFHTRNLPLGSLEQRSPILVPRRGVAVVVMDAGNGDAGLPGGARAFLATSAMAMSPSPTAGWNPGAPPGSSCSAAAAYRARLSANTSNFTTTRRVCQRKRSRP